MNTKKLTHYIAIALIALGVLLLIGGVIYASSRFRHEITCDLTSRGSLEELRQACVDEIMHNKETYAHVTSRNDEIREMMGWSDQDIAKLGLIETK